MPEQLPLWVGTGSLLLNGFYLRQLVRKVDAVYEWICGTPEQPGIADRLRRLESHLNLKPIQRRSQHGA